MPCAAGPSSVLVGAAPPTAYGRASRVGMVPVGGVASPALAVVSACKGAPRRTPAGGGERSAPCAAWVLDRAAAHRQRGVSRRLAGPSSVLVGAVPPRQRWRGGRSCVARRLGARPEGGRRAARSSGRPCSAPLPPASVSLRRRAAAVPPSAEARRPGPDGRSSGARRTRARPGRRSPGHPWRSGAAPLRAPGRTWSSGRARPSVRRPSGPRIPWRSGRVRGATPRPARGRRERRARWW